MAPALHSTPSQARPVSPVDMWDHECVTVENRNPGGLVLPTKREPDARAHGPVHFRNRTEIGMHIDFGTTSRHQPKIHKAAHSDGFDDAVVKLKPQSEAGPFHANNVIPAANPAATERPPRLFGEGKDWGISTTGPMRWLAAGGAGVAVLIVAALAIQELWLMPRKKLPVEPVAVVTAQQPEEEVQGFDPDGLIEQDARALCTAYAMANTPQQVLPIIRNAQRLTKRLQHDWQPWMAPAGWQPARDAEWQVSTEGGVSHGLLHVCKPNFSKSCVYFVREEGSLRIDWEATQGLGDASFETLQKGTGSGGIIRAYVAPANFYSLTFPESQFRSFILFGMDHERVVWGYAKLATPAQSSLEKVFASGAALESDHAQQTITLRLSPGPTGSQKNQWIIGEMLHIGWVSP